MLKDKLRKMIIIVFSYKEQFPISLKDKLNFNADTKIKFWKSMILVAIVQLVLKTMKIFYRIL